MAEQICSFPQLSEADLSMTAAALAAASCSLVKESSDPLQLAHRHFQAHYQFLLEGKWPEPLKGMSDGMDLS